MENIEKYFRPELILSQVIGGKIVLLPEIILAIIAAIFMYREILFKYIKIKHIEDKYSIKITQTASDANGYDLSVHFNAVNQYLISNGYFDKLHSRVRCAIQGGSKYEPDTAYETKFCIVNNNINVKVYSNSDEDKHGKKTINIILLSCSTSIKTLEDFVKVCTDDWDMKLKHKLYTGVFERHWDLELLEDKSTDLVNYQTFDNMKYGKHIEYIKAELDKLANPDNYKNGNRRKLSFLLVGPPGTGKTFIAQAAALYSHKHLVRIPLCNITSANDINKIFRRTIGDDYVDIESKDTILFFDEIDKFITLEPKKQKSITASTDSDDSFDSDDSNDNDNGDANKTTSKTFGMSQTDLLGLLLEQMDSVRLYNGEVYIAAANSIEGLHPAFLRQGRFKVLHFNLLSIDDLIDYGNKIIANSQGAGACVLPDEYDDIFSHAEIFYRDYDTIGEYTEYLATLHFEKIKDC